MVSFSIILFTHLNLFETSYSPYKKTTKTKDVFTFATRCFTMLLLLSKHCNTTLADLLVNTFTKTRLRYVYRNLTQLHKH